jgi:hypothetical protein
MQKISAGFFLTKNQQMTAGRPSLAATIGGRGGPTYLF